ncbi:MAG: hypothetical protein PCFJNLEI_00059 [Verrucomicrobiae bacterium]|nr:hypothetical protein [Verrucomicrobiae bacterium]
MRPRLSRGVLLCVILGAGSVHAESPCRYYQVPALSPIMRLPTVVPEDGKVDDRIEVVATPGEFEPASFVIHSSRDVAKLELTVTGLASMTVDIRVVKCWWQGNSAWDKAVPRYGWPAKLTPELLLHDETLMKVTGTNQNHIRIGDEYMWVREYAKPDMKDPKIPSRLFPEVFPVKDAATLQPVTLTSNESKQFWITVKVPPDVVAGNYAGKINVTADGQPWPPLTLAVQVLPFTLPAPKTYYDTRRDFYSGFMGGGAPRSPRDKEPTPSSRTEEQLFAEYKNRAEHNDLHAQFRVNGRDHEVLRRDLRARAAAGLATRPLVALGSAVDQLFFERKQDTAVDYEKYRQHIAGVLDVVQEVYGHRDVLVDGCDEAPRWIVRRQVPFWKIIHELGGRVFATGDETNFREAGHVQDWLAKPGLPDRAEAARWHAVGGRITMYAAPFAGAESPDLARRNHGLLLYKADYDGSSNYTLWEKRGGFVWDDYYPGEYRAFCMVYPTIDGVIDTLAWEGYREAVDDVKYATLLKTLAEQNPGATAREALRWLEEFDAKTANLDQVRRQMIEFILRLKP